MERGGATSGSHRPPRRVFLLRRRSVAPAAARRLAGRARPASALALAALRAARASLRPAASAALRARTALAAAAASFAHGPSSFRVTRAGRSHRGPARPGSTGSSPTAARLRPRTRRNFTRMPTGTASLRWLRTTTNAAPSWNLHISCEPVTRTGTAPSLRSSTRSSRQLAGSFARLMGDPAHAAAPCSTGARRSGLSP